MAFRDGDSGEWGWTGALMYADSMDDLAMVRAFAEGMAGVKAHRRKK